MFAYSPQVHDSIIQSSLHSDLDLFISILSILGSFVSLISPVVSPVVSFISPVIPVHPVVEFIAQIHGPRGVFELEREIGSGPGQYEEFENVQLDLFLSATLYNVLRLNDLSLDIYDAFLTNIIDELQHLLAHLLTLASHTLHIEHVVSNH